MLSRRDFVHAGCAAAIASLVASPLAQARFPRGGSSGFNGGKSQVGLNIPSLGDYAFMNVMKGAGPWTFISTPSPDAPVTPDLLDGNGYPTSIINGGVYTVFFVPPQNVRPGNYVITWTGNGTVYCGMSNTLVSGSKTGSGGVGRYVFSTTDDRFSIGISATSVTDLKVFHANDEIPLGLGQVFGTYFKQQLAALRPGVIRFMDWLPSNTTNCTFWSTRKSASHVWYSSYELRNAWYCGSATATGAAFSTPFPSVHSSDGTAWTSGGPKDKDTIHVLFATSGTASVSSATNASSAVLTIATTSPNASFNTVGESVGVFGGTGAWSGLNGTFTVSAASIGSVTINFNSTGLGALTGTVTIYHQGSLFTLNVGSSGAVSMLTEYSSTGFENSGNLYPLAKTAGSLATLVYDAGMNAWIKFGGDADPGSMGLQNGVPPELMLQLATEIGAHPYFNIPFLASTPMTDYTTQLATMCSAGAPSWMIPRFEPPNELWNTARGFYQTGYANAKATSYGWGADYQNWYGRAASTIGQAVAAVYGVVKANVKSQTKYQILCGVQTGTAASGGASASNDRLASTLYKLQTPQSGYAADAASDWVNRICLAQYFNPSDQGGANETADSLAYAGATFSGSISGTVLTTSSVLGPLATGHTIQGVGANGAAVAANTTITGGGGSSWTVNNSQTVGAMPMVGGANLTSPQSYAASINSGSNPTNITNLAVLYTAWKTWAGTFTIPGMCGYEGGYSPDFANAGNSDVDRMKAASMLASVVGTGLTSTFNSFVGNTGGGFTAEFPSFYLLAGSPYPQGYVTQVWTASNDIYQSPSSPQWTAIVAFNH